MPSQSRGFQPFSRALLAGARAIERRRLMTTAITKRPRERTKRAKMSAGSGENHDERPETRRKGEGRAPATDLALGRRPPPAASLAYHGLLSGDLFMPGAAAAAARAPLSGPGVLLARPGVSPSAGEEAGRAVVSPRSLSLSSSAASRPSSLNMDLRSFLMLLAMDSGGGLWKPSRSRSLVYWWWKVGRAGGAGRISLSGRRCGRLTRDMARVGGGRSLEPVITGS